MLLVWDVMGEVMGVIILWGVANFTALLPCIVTLATVHALHTSFLSYSYAARFACPSSKSDVIAGFTSMHLRSFPHEAIYISVLYTFSLYLVYSKSI